LSYGQDLRGKKIMITAGGTKEALDPMRFISNNSSGKTGFAMATAAALRGAEVTLIHTDTNEEIPYLTAQNIHVQTVDEMYDACLEHFSQQNWIIKCAAVSDYKPENVSPQKLKKTDELTLRLVQTKDILAELGRRKQQDQILVGFAAETDDLKTNALAKLAAKHLDIIVANHLEVAGKQDTKIIVFSKNDEISYSGDKFHIAHMILDRILSYDR
ncbi:MAG: phosphopantothenoylcysteine decarboxylase, partial [Candidatus Cloacimonadaceae bacterium]|nr:phosphopantothenoylcysteine decarboxylase [Candidatus Cloacimonadaceae bacterium]